MLVAITVTLVSLALILGAVWGLSGKLTPRTEGFLVALSGGALIVSVTEELIRPAHANLSLPWLSLAIAAGAVAFTVADTALEKKMGDSKGGGLLLAITFDGVPENLALGVALIGADAKAVAALAGSIFLSNLPEAAGGANQMKKGGLSRRRVLLLWSGTALVLALCALIGNFALRDIGEVPLSAIRAFAAGAVTASLATEVFPQAYQHDHKETGFAVTLGLILAFVLSDLG
ncbi:ZIP family metal transporter [Pseudooceanicola sp. HF7]|uniref:ZIP family metal transporter n=1 Tax=Pseudooceanicola sp. HF7 TaxID=2721560 RepID=UPI00142F874D|nr:zinc transporter [Pseudooceanicola sp. HF7]NIZ08552.1 zinc transporter [Pseudooceanicola sp. HF7]